MSTVAACMTRDPVCFTPDLPIAEAVAALLKHRISGAPVLDGAGRIAGILTAKDCFRAALHASYHAAWTGIVADYMTAAVDTLDAATDLVTAAQRFLEADYRRFPVTSDGALVGIVTRLDLLAALQAHGPAGGPAGG